MRLKSAGMMLTTTDRKGVKDMKTMTNEQIRKAIKNENARIERRFRKAHKSLIEKNGGKIRGCLVG